jgi:hypothetical protein
MRRYGAGLRRYDCNVFSFLACARNVDLNPYAITNGEHGRNGCSFESCFF